jgi:2-iminobutanoate/2-iminopropanoate deaminase
MPKQVLQSDDAGPPLGAYSQGVRAGDFIFVTGCGPIDPKSGEVRGESIEEQTDLVIDNIQAILAAGGASLADVVKATVHLSDTSLFARFNASYAKRFSEPCPPRITVGSDMGQVPGMKVEIEVIAYVGS